MINKNSNQYNETLNNYLFKVAGEDPAFKILQAFKNSSYYNKKAALSPKIAFKEFLQSGYINNIPTTQDQLNLFFKEVMAASPAEIKRTKNKFYRYSNIIYSFIIGEWKNGNKQQ